MAVVLQIQGEMDRGHPPPAQHALQAVAGGQRLGEALVLNHRLNMRPRPAAQPPYSRAGSLEHGQREPAI